MNDDINHPHCVDVKLSFSIVFAYECGVCRVWALWWQRGATERALFVVTTCCSWQTARTDWRSCTLQQTASRFNSANQGDTSATPTPLRTVEANQNNGVCWEMLKCLQRKQSGASAIDRSRLQLGLLHLNQGKDAWNVQKKGIQTSVAPEAAQEPGTAHCRIPLVAVRPPWTLLTLFSCCSRTAACGLK